MSTDPKKDPSTTSAAYDSMAPVWEKVQTVLDGTDSMRGAGTTYAPQHEFEHDEAYDERIQGAYLFNGSEQTLDSWVGRPFSDPLEVGEDVPADIEELFEDVDLQGNSLSVFARNWYREGLAKAICHVLVDHPDPFENEDNAPRTKEDDRRDNLRPYFSLVEPENLIFAASRIVAAREVLVHVRIRETETVMDGFSESTVQRIRVFDRVLLEDVVDEEMTGVFVSLLEERKDPKSGMIVWFPIKDHIKMDIDEIPIVTFYANRTGLMTGKPPLEDLVDLNVRHWQSTSNQNVTLDVARFPMLGASGMTENEKKKKIVIGPKKVLKTSKADGKYYYIEHTGAAISAGQDELDKVEEKMATYGADFLRKRTGGVTATARALDSAEATSPLQDATHRFNDALMMAIHLLGKWMDIEETGTVGASTEFGPEEVFAGDLQSLKDARQGRDISQETYLAELKRRGVLDDGFDFDQNAQQLDKERTNEMRTEIDIDEGGDETKKEEDGQTQEE